MNNKKPLPDTESFQKNSNLLFSNIGDFFHNKNNYAGLSLFEKINLLNSVISEIKENTNSIEERAINKVLQKTRFPELMKYLAVKHNENQLPLFDFNEIDYANTILDHYHTLKKSEEEIQNFNFIFRLLNEKEEINVGCVFLHIKNTTNNEASAFLYDNLIHQKFHYLCDNKLTLIQSKIDMIESIEKAKEKYEGAFQKSNPLLNDLIMAGYADKIKNELSGSEIELFNFICKNNEHRQQNNFINKTAKAVQLSNEANQKLADKMESVLGEINTLADMHQEYITHLDDPKSLFLTDPTASPVVVKPVKKIERPEPQKLIDISRLTPKDRLKENLLRQIEKNKIKNKTKNGFN